MQPAVYHMHKATMCLQISCGLIFPRKEETYKTNHFHGRCSGLAPAFSCRSVYFLIATVTSWSPVDDGSQPLNTKRDMELRKVMPDTETDPSVSKHDFQKESEENSSHGPFVVDYREL